MYSPAVVSTCSDSRVSPELIFDAGIEELFVVKTASNVIGDFEMGSFEYGVGQLGVKAVVVLGHSGCGAVAAAIDGHAGGNAAKITDKIKPVIQDQTDASVCEDLNIDASAQDLLKSEVLKKLYDNGEITISKMKYDLAGGAVSIK